MRNVTINDIAEKLGVTPSTISRALAGNKRVSEKTRELVQKVAKEMGYQPNLMASSLRKGKSDLIGMIVPRINRHFFSNVISGVEEILNPAGYSLLIMQTHEQLQSEVKAVQSLMSNRVAGIIASLSVETNDFAHLQGVVDAHVPLVQFDRVCNDLNGSKIVNDNFTGAYEATKNLLSAGYKRVAHFGGSHLLNAYRERQAGYEAAVKEELGEVDRSLIIENAITREVGYLNIIKLIKEGNADAVFCAGDYSAFGAIEGLKEMNIKVPEEFGVAGFSNEPFAEMLHPSLTTVEQHGNEMGRIAAQEMIHALEGSINNIERVVSVKFIARESSRK
jgi:LacI family transcriptional regulator